MQTSITPVTLSRAPLYSMKVSAQKTCCLRSGQELCPSTDGRLAIMISTKGFSVQAREARIIYLSCLSCLVILVVFFSLNLLPQFGLRSLHLTGGHSKTQHDYQSIYHNDGSANKTDDGEPLSLTPSHSTTTKPTGSKGLKYAIILPTYVGFLRGHAEGFGLSTFAT